MCLRLEMVWWISNLKNYNDNKLKEDVKCM